jgi:hypothetical protein
MLKELPKVTILRMESIEPSLAPERIDIDEPTSTMPNREVAPWQMVFALTLTPEPMRVKDLRDNPLPSTAKLRTERQLPRRANARRDRLLPTSHCRMTLAWKMLPSLAKPRTDKFEPQLPALLNDNEDAN